MSSNDNGVSSGNKSNNDKVILTSKQKKILDEKATEAPFTGKLNNNFEDGHYECVRCGNILFDSSQKFASSCGWPAFSSVKDGALKETEDRSFLMIRTEVSCSKCGGHFGHVFNDGPPPTGLRYCINSEVLRFVPGNNDGSNTSESQDG